MTTASYVIAGGDYERGGAASRSVKEQLKKVGADPAVVRRAMVAAYEAEMNVVIHAYRGELRAVLEDGQLDVEVIDEGPGIADVDQAMREGFSTAPAAARELGFGAGMGLPNIRRNSDRFAIESIVGKGTRVRFGIKLKPQALYGSGRHSLHVAAETCRASFRCVSACPTQAMRVFRGRPEVLDYLCVDCAACIAACPSGALRMAGDDGEFTPSLGTVLVVPTACLVQFGAGVEPNRVLAELTKLGFAEVVVGEAWDVALRDAVVAHATGHSEAVPVISPACPAVVNLIETRFPSLIRHLAPYVSAFEAIHTNLEDKSGVFVVTCPCQRTTLVHRETDRKPSIVLPVKLRAMIMPRLVHGGEATQGDSRRMHRPEASESSAVLRITGWPHVMRILEGIEDGLVGDIGVVEPWACDEGCFGSPLLAEDAVLARRRWVQAGTAFGMPGKAVRRTRPFTPRPGLRLDNDMVKAIGKLAKIDKLKGNLPGSDCGMCGAPTCAALAEDIVLGRAELDACVRRAASREKTS
jgi:anti-sigma regulatory factor (Ser/Thr protein kinase)/Na+-translocating ferredoxin:NAD+ oxidoreductase RNF subunit RnfB